MEQVTSGRRGEPRGEPVAYYFRDLLLIGGEATRLYLLRHAPSEGNRGEDEGPDNDPPPPRPAGTGHRPAPPPTRPASRCPRWTTSASWTWAGRSVTSTPTRRSRRWPCESRSPGSPRGTRFQAARAAPPPGGGAPGPSP